MIETLPVDAPKPVRSSRARSIGAPAIVVASLFVVAGVSSAITLALRPPSLLPEPTTTVTEVTPSPDVVLAIQSLAKLESITFHLERVVDLADREKRFYGLVEAKDAILLVAVGDVVAGSDLGAVGKEDVDADFEHKRITVRLPPPEILSTRLDDEATHVYARTTDTLAARHEDLEQRARKEALRTMQKAAIDGGILDKARAETARAVRGLLEASGFREVDVRFRDP